MSVPQEFVAVLDFGSQYAQLIARRIREHEVYAEILPHTTPAAQLRGGRAPIGIVLTGGPASVYAEGAPRCDPEILRLGVPVLAICYGMQLACLLLGGDVRPAAGREFGRTRARVLDAADLLEGVPAETTVWMSHGDAVDRVGADFRPLAATDNCPLAAVRHRSAPVYGVQFHPEVTHTVEGGRIFRNFLYRICRARGEWRTASLIERAVAGIREQVKDAGVVCGLSGGVDSAVTALLGHRAVGERLASIFVDNGLLRVGEREAVEKTFREALGLRLRTVDAAERFLEALRGVTDPEEKRTRIGHLFVDVFAEEARGIPGARFLAQGTLYPDVIESVSAHGGPTARIKTHHNVGGLPAALPFGLVEPLRDLFKDEVRRMGTALGLPEDLVWRHPFPGPGLAVRVLGEVTRERLATVRAADAIVREEIRRAGLERHVAQAFAVLLPVASVGVMGDGRTYEAAVAVRAVTTDDFMTADWARLPAEVLATISSRIINEVRGVNRVVYDVSTKPPSTIEWE
ncbi:MAG: glutamine-hydrolyzing GMP synthase [Planctomycetales bacterium]|nr:glutamine-hydrolyzing GMP synthase [Planctomycetales bacterium]